MTFSRKLLQNNELAYFRFFGYERHEVALTDSNVNRVDRRRMYLDQNLLACANWFRVVCSELKHAWWPKFAEFYSPHLRRRSARIWRCHDLWCPAALTVLNPGIKKIYGVVSQLMYAGVAGHETGPALQAAQKNLAAIVTL